MSRSPSARDWTWRRRYSLLTVLTTAALISWGGFVTSIEAGMAFPDWPTSLGSYNLINPVDRWWAVTPYLAEHGHRLIAAFVGFLTIGLAGWTWWSDPRAWMRKLGFAALGLVIVQGVLGGLRVVWISVDLAMVHACAAQLFFATLVAMWFFTTDTWRNRRGLFTASPEASRFRTVATAATALIYVQIVLGAFLRQHGRGIDEWAATMHVTGAFLATGLVLAVFVLAQKHFDDNAVIRRASWVLLGTVGVQFALGLSAFIVMLYEAPQGIRSTLQVLLTVGHLVGGSVLLGASVVTTLLARRPAVDALADDAPADRVQPASDGASTVREPALTGRKPVS